jgi:hypothetical protein
MSNVIAIRTIDLDEVRNELEGALGEGLESGGRVVLGRDGKPEAVAYYEPGMSYLPLESLTLEQLAVVQVLFYRHREAESLEVERLAEKICPHAFEWRHQGYTRTSDLTLPTGTKYGDSNYHECKLVIRAYERAAELLTRKAESLGSFVEEMASKSEITKTDADKPAT